jgi:hypothetical protein
MGNSELGKMSQRRKEGRKKDEEREDKGGTPKRQETERLRYQTTQL